MMSEKPVFKSERDKMGYNEATRDPIFLLQRRTYVYDSHHPRVRYDSNRETLVHRDNGRILTDKRLVEMEAATEVWETDRVFYSREEGEAYGKARAYNFRKGWRVYCVCAEGSLARVLKNYDTEEDRQAAINEVFDEAAKMPETPCVEKFIGELALALTKKKIQRMDKIRSSLNAKT